MKAFSYLSRTPFLFLFAAALLAGLETAAAQNQTNDPLVNQQQYLFDVHRVDQAWTYTTGSSNTKIGLYSMTGFIQNHEDLPSGRLLAPEGSLLDPELDYASEMAGIVGAATNNGVGMAGIDRAARLQSYSILLPNQSCTDCEDEERPVTFERPDGTTETYHLNLYRFSDLLDEGRSNDIDVHLFAYGLPSGDPLDYALPEPSDTNPLNSSGIPSEWDIVKSDAESALSRIFGHICGDPFGLPLSWLIGDCFSPPDPLKLFRETVGFAVANDDGVVVAAAGDLNDDGDMPTDYLPGMYDPYALTVGGVVLGADDRIVEWERTRPAGYVDVAGFAEGVVGVSSQGASQYNADFAGTAAAGSIGAGVAGLLKAENSALTGEDVEEILVRTAQIGRAHV